MAVALRNRDRLLLVWPLVHEYLAAVLAPEGPRGASALVARAALGLLRVCQRLLPYKEDTADALLRSLGLVLRLRPSAAWELAQRLATEARAGPTRARAPACVPVPRRLAARPGRAAASGARCRRSEPALRAAPAVSRRPVLSVRRLVVEAPPPQPPLCLLGTLYIAPAQVSMPG